MKKKSDKPSGVSLPELKEVLKRLKDKEPELEAVIDREEARRDPEAIAKDQAGNVDAGAEIPAKCEKKDSSHPSRSGGKGPIRPDLEPLK